MRTPSIVRDTHLVLDALGGTKYWGASAELQMPFWFLPKEVGLRGAVYADAGSLWDYQGPTSWAVTGEVNSPTCPTCAMQYDDTNIIRTSVGVGLIWQSPFPGYGPDRKSTRLNSSHLGISYAVF